MGESVIIQSSLDSLKAFKLWLLTNTFVKLIKKYSYTCFFILPTKGMEPILHIFYITIMLKNNLYSEVGPNS